MRFIPFPIRALVVIVGAEKRMQSLWRMQHVIVGSAGALVVLIILSRRIQPRKFRIKLVIRNRARRSSSAVRGIEGKRWRAFKGRAQDRDRLENVRPDQSRPGGDRRPGVMPRNHRYFAVPE